MKYIKIYLTCLRTSFSCAAAYRMDFILGNLITLLSNIIFPLVTVLIYANGASFPQWDMWEVLLIQSVFSMSGAVSSMVSGSILWVTMDHIQEGSFETVLLKPLSPLFYITAANFSTGSIGLFLGSLVMTVVSAFHTGICGISGILLFLLLFISGIAVMGGLDLIMAAISFKWVGNSRIPEIFGSIEEFGKFLSFVELKCRDIWIMQCHIKAFTVYITTNPEICQPKNNKNGIMNIKSKFRFSYIIFQAAPSYSNRRVFPDKHRN